MPRKSKKFVSAQTKKVARNLRILRELRKVSQQDVGNFLGVSFQQVQKYEKGVNRLSMEGMHKLKQLYDVPYEAFFYGLENEHEATGKDGRAVMEEINQILLVCDDAVRRKARDILYVLAT